MGKLYNKIADLAMHIEGIIYHYGTHGNVEFLQNSVKRLARWCRKAGDEVYWDKQDYSTELLNECLDYIFYVYCT